MDGLKAWRAWRSWLRASRADDTTRSYVANVLRFLAETACKPLDEYTEADCAEFLAAHASRGSARYEYAKALRSFFGWASRRMYVAADPMAFIEVRRPRRVHQPVLTDEELVRLLVAAVFTWGERQAWGILLVYVLGVRRKEAAGLRWSDIRAGETGPVIEIHETKGVDQRDPLPLTPLALECLARIRKLPVPAQARRGREYVLGVSRAQVSAWVHAAGVAAGLPPRKVGAHRLRASLATGLLREGVDVRVVQKILGHLRLESTAWYLEDPAEMEMRRGLERAGLAGLRVAV